MDLFTLFGRIIIDSTEANRIIDDTANNANNAESEISGAFSKIGGVASKIATGIGIAGAAIGGAFIATIESTREYRNEMGLLESAFLTAGHSSDEAKNTYSDLNAVMRDSGAAVEASQHLALVADNESELSEMTHTLTGVYATFGASLPLEGLAEAINHSSSLGEVQGSLADALEWSGITVDDFNAQLAECSTEEERQDLIMKTLKDTYSEAADQYKETNKDVMDAEKANEALADAFAELGAVGEPILTAIKEKVAEMVSVAAPKIQEFIDKIKDCITWIKENENTVDTWVAVIGGATIAVGSFLLILSWGKIMTAAKTAIQTVTIAVKAFNLALKSNPIGLVISIIAGLVAAIIYLWNTNEDFRKFWINAWEKIKEAASKAWEAIKNAWSKAKEWFSDIYQSIQKSGSEAMNKVQKFFSDAWQYVKNAWNSCISFFKSIYSGITSAFSSIGSWFGNIFKNAFNGVKSAFGGIVSWMGSVWDSIKQVFSNVTSWFRNIFGTAFGYVKDIVIKAFQAGGKIFSGIKEGLEKTFKSLVNTIISGINTIIAVPLKAVNSILKKLKNIEVLKIKPFTWISTFDIPKIPKLAEGIGIAEKGKQYLLEGTGTEAVVPLERNTGWLDEIAERLQSRTQVNTIELNQVMQRLNTIISILEKLLGMNIYLDSGVLVGELAPGINANLGAKYNHSNRGNIK